MTIPRNSALCLRCGDEIESRHVHDFVRCSCEAIFVDGGKDYLRRGGSSLLKDTSLFSEGASNASEKES